MVAQAARKARHRSTRPRGRSARQRQDRGQPGERGAQPMPRAIARIASRPTRSSTAPTATIASPGAVVRSKRTAPASSSAATRQACHGQERHDARGQSRLRSERADLGIDTAALVETPRERSQQRGQIASRTQLQRDGRGCESRTLAERRRKRSCDVLAGRGATARERERIAGGAAGRACGDESAIRGATRTKLRSDPPQCIGQLALERALAADGAEAPDAARPARASAPARLARHASAARLAKQGGDHAGSARGAALLDGRPRDELPALGRDARRR